MVSIGTAVGATLRVDRAEDDGIFCADGDSASDASPNAGSVVRLFP